MNHLNPDKIKNVLITGGTGFMGSNFVRHLYNKYPGYRIFVLDLLTYAGSLDNLESVMALEKMKYYFL